MGVAMMAMGVVMMAMGVAVMKPMQVALPVKTR